MFKRISNVAVCEGGNTYQLCQPNKVNVNAATIPNTTHNALASGRIAAPIEGGEMGVKLTPEGDI